MSAETDLRAELVAHAPLLAAVGGAPNRIAFDKVPQNTPRPYVVMVRDETETITTLDGVKHGARVVFQIQCWADTRSAAEALADLVEDALAASTVEPNGIPVSDRTSGYEPDLDLEAANLSVEWWDGV